MNAMLQTLDGMLHAFQRGTRGREERTAVCSPRNTPASNADCEAESPFINLPAHVAVQIVPFMELDDLRNATLVCHAWLAASNAAVLSLEPAVFEPRMFCKRFTNLESMDLSRAKSIDDLSLGELASLSRLQRLNLKRCKNISSESFDQLLCLSRLTFLCLARCTMVTDEVIGKVAGYMTGLRSLNIKYCYKITDAGLQGVGSLKCLTYLNCSMCRRITDAGVQALSNAGALRTLKISNCAGITGVGMLSIGKLSNLVVLHARMDSILEGIKTDESIATISTALPFLSKLDITLGNRITIGGIDHLQRARSLRRLSLGRCRLPGDQLARSLAAVASLDALSLSDVNHLSNAGLAHIAQLHNLRSLSLTGSVEDNKKNTLTDKGLETLTGLQQLAELHLTAFPSVWGTTVHNLVSLTSLSLNCCPLWQISAADSCIKKISQLTNLRSLNLSGNSNITDRTIANLSALTNLETLTLCDCQKLECLSIHCLSDLKKLTALTLSLCQRVSDCSLKAVVRISSLVDVNLGYCSAITDAGIVALGDGKLKYLRSVNIAGCNKISEEAAEELKASLPNLKRLERKQLSITLLRTLVLRFCGSVVNL